jgi:small-conductance mechanosensitive channel
VTAGVVTEFGSLATFAGLITAGVAVALQAVILSGVAYFFFIGRFGVRVGDRVTIGAVTGDVIEVGILRLYLAELVGKPTDLHPTGRIVVFSNSVLFQPQAFYKQMPGANYVWHEVAFTLSPETDVKVAERRLVGAVERVYERYKASLARGKVLSGMRVEEGELRPEGRLRFAEDGVELVVRYPVEVRRAAEEDDRMTRELLAAIEEEPKLKLAAGGRMIQPA